VEDDMANEEQDVAGTAWDITKTIGEGLADVTGVAEVAGAGVAGLAVGAAAAVGVGTGMLIEDATDGAISDGIADRLHALVGDDESSAAADSFTDGDVLGGIGHMVSGAADTVGGLLGEAADWATDAGGDATDWATDTAGDATDWAEDTAGGVVDWAQDTAGEAYDDLSQYGEQLID
jgi:hypothetical protein